MLPFIRFISLFLFAAQIIACSPKGKSRFVEFSGESTQQKWAVKDLNPDLPSDWSTYNYLTFKLKASSTQHFYLNLYDAEGIRRLSVHPFQNAWVRTSIPLIHFQKRNVIGHDMAAIAKTALPGLWIGFSGMVGTINQVDSIGVHMNLPINAPTLEICDISLTMEPRDSILSPLPVVDKFGQWVADEWEGKTQSMQDLKSIWVREESSLIPGDFNHSKYGGYLDTKAEATGFFRVEKIDGKWWFVDPEGHLFFSVGSTGIRTGNTFPRIQGREYIYDTLPPDNHTKNTSQGVSSSFYDWNLQRRFGDNWYQEWMELTVRRMNAWGLNTVANWSDENLGRLKGKPYVATLRGWEFNPNTMGMPDVYDPGYADRIEEAARKQCVYLKNDPYLLGYFVGNEPPWPGREQDLVNIILENEDTPMKAALKEYLKEEDTPERRKDFVYETYILFITTVNKAIKKYDPNHLNLGLRFGGNPSDDIIKASASVGFDVFSLNIYGYSTYKDRLERIDHYTGLPIIIGEFHFGTPGRGLAPGLAQTLNQKERGVAYRYYVENAAAHPSLVGTHWFQWWDQPSTGRFDGENYNIGFVSIIDVPYEELVVAAKETHLRIKDIHSGKVKPTNLKAKVQ
ncbi:MAG: hypothetical protein WDA19_04050 [Mariniphaga sp.]